MPPARTMVHGSASPWLGAERAAELGTGTGKEPPLHPWDAQRVWGSPCVGGSLALSPLWGLQGSYARYGEEGTRSRAPCAP